ncbi:MAG: hypothetical protein A2444_02215 [Candidatus Staskawiczbacteria bacterium RIFOXYC2_FULL_37_19]|nr:MAG: hypothetical protein A2444_02215 [Candidatus Staskawiczbacteria bacterium RIFOXYC2_FULL_37_19]
MRALPQQGVAIQSFCAFTLDCHVACGLLAMTLFYFICFKYSFNSLPKRGSFNAKYKNDFSHFCLSPHSSHSPLNS